MEELLQTEEAYVEDLRLIVEVSQSAAAPFRGSSKL